MYITFSILLIISVEFGYEKGPSFIFLLNGKASFVKNIKIQLSDK